MKVFYEIVSNCVGQDIDLFLGRYLKEHYDRRRQILSEAGIEFQLIPAIDYVFQTCISETASQYPPENSAKWHQCFQQLGSGHSHVFQQMLLIYLKLDLETYLSHRERESTAGRQTRARDRAELTTLQTTVDRLAVVFNFDFANSIVKLSEALWALDNDQTNLMIKSLSDPNINLANFFETPKELVKIIVGTLYKSSNNRMALYVCRIHRCENWEEEFNSLYASLLISSGQIAEALKYERLFVEHENYHDILHRFFGICSKLDVTKSLNCLNLSIDEEEALNQYLAIESRPVTPSTTVHTTLRQFSSPLSTVKSKHTPRNRRIHVIQKMPSFTDSPARNTRSARKKKTVH